MAVASSPLPVMTTKGTLTSRRLVLDQEIERIHVRNRRSVMTRSKVRSSSRASASLDERTTSSSDVGRGFGEVPLGQLDVRCVGFDIQDRSRAKPAGRALVARRAVAR